MELPFPPSSSCKSGTQGWRGPNWTVSISPTSLTSSSPMSKQLSCIHQIKMKFCSGLEKKIHLLYRHFISWASRFALLNLVLATQHSSSYASHHKTQDFGPNSLRKTWDHSNSAKAFYRFPRGKKGGPLVLSTLLAHFCLQSNR